MKKTNLLLKLTLCLMVVVGIQSNADGATAIATVGTNTPAPNITFSGMCNGNFQLQTNNAFIRSKVGFGINLSVSVQISPMVGNCADYQISPLGIWHLPMGDPNGQPSSFQVTDNATGNILLSGRFRGAVLHGASGSSSLALTLPSDSVVYNAASLWFPADFPLNKGTFAIAIISQTRVRAVPFDGEAGGPFAFAANGDINFGRQ